MRGLYETLLLRSVSASNIILVRVCRGDEGACGDADSMVTESELTENWDRAGERVGERTF